MTERQKRKRQDRTERGVPEGRPPGGSGEEPTAGPPSLGGTPLLTDVSSEHEAMMLSMKGFHLMSSTLPW